MRMRAPVPDDAPAVLAVLVARDVADLGAPDYALDDLRDEWRGSEFDLAADAVVVEADDGRVVGYAAVRGPGTLAVVAPDREGRGIGVRLLQWAERRERERGRERHRQWVAASNARGRELLRASGYERARSYWRMVRRLDDVAHGVKPPVGVGLRPLDVDGDAAALHALDAASFAANADYEPESFGAFCEEHLLAHDLDPELSCVAEDGGGVVGFLLARRWQHEAVGYVDILAVHPDQQKRGLGTALLRTAFVRFAVAGIREAQLGVASDNPRALRLYERVGMSTRFQFDTYERAIRASRQTSTIPSMGESP
jgi:mycothiol synthase